MNDLLMISNNFSINSKNKPLHYLIKKMCLINFSENNQINTIHKFLYHNCFVLFVTFIVCYITYKNCESTVKNKG